MNKEDFDNDEPIHHFEGKDLLHSCPSEPPSVQPGSSSSPIKHSPKATISPPDIHSHKDRFQKFHKIKELLRGIFFYKIHKETTHYPMVNYNLFIGQMNIATQNNQTILQDMKNFGPIFNIYNKGTIINNFGTDNQSNEQAEAEEAKDVDHTEVVEVQTNPTREDNLPSIIRFFAQRSKARPILKWLHETTDDLETPKERLMNVRAVYEAGHFTQRIPYKVYVEEFGPITKSRYKHWMGEELNYGKKDIDDIIEQFPF